MNGPVKRNAKPTPFSNFKHRVIFKTKAGAYFVKTTKGIAYKPKAKFYKNPAGSTVSTKYVKNLTHIPTPIRPKFDRKERKNAGYNRLPYAKRTRGVRVLPIKRKAYITELEEGHKAKRGRGRPRKHLVSPGGNMGLAALFGGKPIRATRKNKGVARKTA